MENIELLRLLAYTLEQTLAEYESECLKSKPASRKLGRMEEILKRAFIPAAKDFSMNRAALFAGVRVSQILRYMDAGDDAEAAVARFILRNRYKSGMCDTEVEVEGVKVKFYLSFSRATNAANEFTTLTSEQHKPLRVASDQWLIKNVVSGQVRDAAGEVQPEVASKLLGAS
jgi:hypothetical protein